MKRLLLVAAILMLGAGMLVAQTFTTIRQFSENPLDSLLKADTLQNTVTSRWTLQAAPRMGDTVRITARCVVPAGVLTFTLGKFTMLLYDTARTTNTWGAVLVRVSGVADTAQIILDGFLNVERDDIIQMTGVVQEFPTLSMNSVTQFQPIAGRPITILSSNAQRPQYIQKNVSDFYRGIFQAPPSTYPVRYSTGEPLEWLLVQFTNLTIDAKVNTGRGTFSAVDASGNQITMYDASHYWTLGHGSTIVVPGDTAWTAKYAQIGVGTKIDTLRGCITTVSGSENPRGYRIAPIYPKDVVFGITLPSVSTHRRNPVVVTPDSAARISVKVLRQPGGFPLGAVSLLYSVNNGSFINLAMTLNASDTTYRTQIPQQVDNTFIHYFIRAADSLGNVVILANPATGAFSTDTSKGFFFYTVLSRSLTIRDIEQTPYVNGSSGYVGGVVTLSGIVTADTADVRFATTTSENSPWYLQSTNQPWSGIWVTDTLMTPRRRGDSITVTGTVAEQFNVTRIQNLTSAPIVRSTGNTLPTPVALTTGRFGSFVGNGDPSAEPYEGMLVQFNNAVVTDTAFWTFQNPKEPAVDDGTGAILLRMDGKDSMSTVPSDSVFGYTILKPGKRISYLQGIMWFSFNRYKITPRRRSDYGTVTGVEIDHEPGVPAQYALAQNYPNPFNPSTVIEYSLPSSVPVVLKIYSVLGQEVETLVNEMQTPGNYKAHFDADRYATGIYFYSLRAGDFRQVKKMLLLK
jgi:hypothetical protein